MMTVTRRSVLKALAVPGAWLSATQSKLGADQRVIAPMPRIIVFDVNETLLDIAALEPHFTRAFGDRTVLRDWFSTVLLYSEVENQSRDRKSTRLNSSHIPLSRMPS